MKYRRAEAVFDTTVWGSGVGGMETWNKRSEMRRGCQEKQG